MCFQIIAMRALVECNISCCIATTGVRKGCASDEPQ
jgi:hypothetical protein